MVELTELREELQEWFSEDWNYAYRRLGPKMEVEYHARLALRALDELEYRLKEYHKAQAAGGFGRVPTCEDCKTPSYCAEDGRSCER
jgi:hypothetical protein